MEKETQILTTRYCASGAKQYLPSMTEAVAAHTRPIQDKAVEIQHGRYRGL